MSIIKKSELNETRLGIKIFVLSCYSNYLKSWSDISADKLASKVVWVLEIIKKRPTF